MWWREASSYLAHVVTGTRVALIPAFLWAVDRAESGGPVLPAALLFAAIATSDYVDGRLARHFGSAGRAGRIFDHFADITFVLSALAMYVWLRVTPWWVPAAIAVSFAAYVADSWSRRDASSRLHLIGSRIGHAAGIANYTLIGLLVARRVLNAAWLSEPLVEIAYALVPLYSAAAVSTRIPGAWRASG